MSKLPDIKELLSFFPEVEPPFTLTEESIQHFRQTNEDLPFDLVFHFIENWEGPDEDEMTEYFPCLKLPKQEKYQCLIYYRTALLKYEYIAATIDSQGNLISRKVIAGTNFKDGFILRSAARIDEDIIIHIVTGVMDPEMETDIDPEKSQLMTMEILPDGQILGFKDEETIPKL